MKKLFITLMLAAVAVACNRGSETETPGMKGIVVLNNGLMGMNNSCLSLYDPDTKKLDADVFKSCNGQLLGDTAQDILVHGEDIFITVTGSKVIFVTDRNFVIRKAVTAKAGGHSLSPRYMAACGDKIYVTYYEGYLGEIDPSSDYSVRTTAVGSSPEGLAYASGRIYVANSGGLDYPDYGKTVSVVDLKAFKEISKIGVNLNPQQLVANADGSMLYLASWGDMGDNPARLQAIGTADGKVSDLDFSGVQTIFQGKGDEIFIVCGFYASDWTYTAEVHRMDMNTQKVERNILGNPVSKYLSFSYGGGYIFVGTGDYTTNGDLLVYDYEGKPADKFDTGGLNPVKAIFLN